MVWFKDGPPSPGDPHPEGLRPPGAPGEEKLTYEGYLRVTELLRLQRPESQPPEHDELQFIVVHQTYELWFKLVLHELDEVGARMAAGDVRESARLVRRVVEIQKVLVAQIHILETMLPGDFLRFRDKLQPASGFQSAQFREIEYLAGFKDEGLLRFFAEGSEPRARLERRLGEATLGDRFNALLVHAGLLGPEGERDREARLQALKRAYTSQETVARDVVALAEALLDFDELISIWRFHHVRMAERVIGKKPGTGGSQGVEYLASTVSAKARAFPDLWEVRTLL